MRVIHFKTKEIRSYVEENKKGFISPVALNPIRTGLQGNNAWLLKKPMWKKLND